MSLTTPTPTSTTPTPDQATTATPDGIPPVSTRSRARRRTRYVVAASVCVGALVAVIVLSVVLSQNVVYFRTVSEAVRTRASQGQGQFRMAGAVVPHTVHATATGVRFDMTDGHNTVQIDHTGSPPELFKDGAPVVCQGHWAQGTAEVFDSSLIMIKHGAEYSPPKVDASHAPPASSPSP